MQVYANLATNPQIKFSQNQKTYFEFRVAESHRNDTNAQTCWYTVRLMQSNDPGLAKGDFVKITGKLKTDFYLSREGKPTGTLLIIAFEASKISKPVVTQDKRQDAKALETVEN